MAIFKKFGSLIATASFLFAVFWLPKDLEDSPQAIQPWKRILSMVDQNTALWAFALCALAYIFWMDARPFISAYRNRHNSARVLEISGLVPDIRAADSQSVRNLLGGGERDKFVALLQSGRIRAWVRPKNGERHDLTPADSELWHRRSIEYVEIGGKPQTLITGPDGVRREKPWSPDHHDPMLTRLFDVHFNRADLNSIWPNVNF